MTDHLAVDTDPIHRQPDWDKRLWEWTIFRQCQNRMETNALARMYLTLAAEYIINIDSTYLAGLATTLWCHLSNYPCAFAFSKSVHHHLSKSPTSQCVNILQLRLTIRSSDIASMDSVPSSSVWD